MLREQNAVELKLLTGDVFNGIIVWQDAHAICLSVDGQTVITMRTAIAYVKVAN